MHRVTVEMPIIRRCAVSDCVFNAGQACHAKAITVGNAIEPGCDTYLNGRRHAHDVTRIAGVGACKVTQCRHNDDFECVAEMIQVGFKNGDVNCLTFDPRP